MTKREVFIKFVEKMMEYEYELWDVDVQEEWKSAIEFFNEFKENKTSDKITENGQKILRWLQDNTANSSDTFTAKEIAEGLSTTGRSVAGSMRKLVKDEYVEKQGKDPIQYSLTAKGEDWS